MTSEKAFFCNLNMMQKTKIDKIINNLERSNLFNKFFYGVISEQDNKNKKNIFQSIIKETKIKDVSELSLFFIKHGILKFKEIAAKKNKEFAFNEMSRISDEKEGSIQELIKKEKKEIISIKKSQKKNKELIANYSIELENLIIRIISNSNIKTQEDVLHYRKKNKKMVFFKSKKEVINLISKYYNLCDCVPTITCGDNIIKEYESLIKIKNMILDTTKEVVFIKNNLWELKEELKIKKNRTHSDCDGDSLFDATLKEFIEYSEKEKMLDFYIAKFKIEKKIIAINNINDFSSLYSTFNLLQKESNNYQINFYNKIRIDLKFNKFKIIPNLLYFEKETQNRLLAEKKITIAIKKNIYSKSLSSELLYLKIKDIIKGLSGIYESENNEVFFDKRECEKLLTIPFNNLNGYHLFFLDYCYYFENLSVLNLNKRDSYSAIYPTVFTNNKAVYSGTGFNALVSASSI